MKYHYTSKEVNGMPKSVRYILASIFCFVVLIVAVYAGSRATNAPVWSSEMYETEELFARQQGLDIRGQKPVILEEFGTAYAELNEEIEDVIATLIEGTRRIRARSVTFGFEIFDTNEVVSIVISATARAVTDRTTVLSVNFNPRTGAPVSLVQVMGNDIAALAEVKIDEMIRKDPATYFAAFNAPPTGQAFYLTDTSLFLLFDEFQLSSVPGAASHIEFELENIRRFTLPRADYRISPDRYAIRMIPLSRVVVAFGYTTRWDGSAREATVYLNGEVVIVLREGENNYQLNGVLQRSLEAAPVIHDGNMYVPISFFDQILSLTSFSIDTRGNITFIAYMGRSATGAVQE